MKRSRPNQNDTKSQTFRMGAPSIMVLVLFAQHRNEEMFGQQIRTRTNIAAGTLYPMLRRFENAGLLSSRWEDVDPRVAGRPRRKLYRIQDSGIDLVKNTLSAAGLRIQTSEGF